MSLRVKITTTPVNQDTSEETRRRAESEAEELLRMQNPFALKLLAADPLTVFNLKNRINDLTKRDIDPVLKRSLNELSLNIDRAEEQAMWEYWAIYRRYVGSEKRLPWYLDYQF